MAKKMTSELKIGILVTVCLVTFVLGFNFLRGNGVFSSDKTYYTIYDNVSGLQEASSVLYNGLKVGKVSDIELQPDRKVKVTFRLQKGITLYEGVSAQMFGDNLLAGSKAINLVFPANIDSTTKIIEEDELVPSQTQGDLMGELTGNLKPILGTANKALSSVDSILLSINTIINKDASSHIDKSLMHLETTLNNLSSLTNALNQQTNNIAGLLNNANSITGNLAKNNENISATLSNLNGFTNQLKDAPIDKTLKDLQQTVNNLNGIVSKLNSKDGSLGLLLSDDKLYYNLNGTLQSLEALMTDLKAHPSKYINVSVFSGKK